MNLHETIHVIRAAGHETIFDYGGYQSRHASTLKMMHYVLEAWPDLQQKDLNFRIYTGDDIGHLDTFFGSDPVLVYAKDDHYRGNVHTIPDFIFGGWPEAGIDSYALTTEEIMYASFKRPRYDKVMWAGCTQTHPGRDALMHYGSSRPDDTAFTSMEWKPTFTGLKQDTTSFISLRDHTEYSMLLDIRGKGYSGRQKLLLHSGRPLFIVDNPFREYFHEDLRPFEHFIPVREDFSNLDFWIRELRASKELRNVGVRAQGFALLNLSPRAAHLRWEKVLRSL